MRLAGEVVSLAAKKEKKSTSKSWMHWNLVNDMVG